MRRIAAFVLLATLPLFTATPIHAGVDVVGDANRVILQDRQSTGNDASHVPASAGKASTAKSGRPRVVQRGRGDRPPVESGHLILRVGGHGSPC